MFDFPTSPSIGNTANGYTWNGYAWMSDAPAAVTIPDGDKGDIVVSGSGTTWLLDSAVTTSISGKVAKTGDTMSGRLGIGAPIPAEFSLHVRKGSAGTPPAWNNTDVVLVENTAGDSSVINILSSNAAGGFVAFSDTDAKNRGTVSYLHSTDTLQLQSAGNITINPPNGFSTVVTANTASNSPTTGALTVAGGVGIAKSISLGATPYGAGSAAIAIGYTGAGTQYGITLRPTLDSSNALLFYNAAGSGVGSISTTASATTYNTSSDGRLKEDLKSFDAGNIIDATEVYDFAWKSVDERAYGIVAQQAVEVYPQAITYSENEDWWGVDYSKYVPVILQELKALRARVTELEGKGTIHG